MTDVSQPQKPPLPVRVNLPGHARHGQEGLVDEVVLHDSHNLEWTTCRVLFEHHNHDWFGDGELQWLAFRCEWCGGTDPRKCDPCVSDPRWQGPR